METMAAECRKTMIETDCGLEPTTGCYITECLVILLYSVGNVIMISHDWMGNVTLHWTKLMSINAMPQYWLLVDRYIECKA